MFKLVLFEMRKVWKSTYFIVMLGLLFFFISTYFIYSYIQTERVEDVILRLEEQKFSYQVGLDELQSEMDAAEIDPEDDFVKRELQNYQEPLDRLNEQIEAVKQGNWDFILEEELIYTENYLQTFPSQAHEDIHTWPTHFTHEFIHERNQWLKEKEIAPVFPIHYMSEITYYDRVFDDPIIEEAAHSFFNKYSSSTIYFLYLLFGLGFGVAGVCYFLFLFGDILTKEGLGRNGPIQFLYTQTLTSWKVLMGKYLTVLFLSLMILGGVIFLSYLLGLGFERVGAWNYPVLIYEPEFQFHLMNMGKFNVLSTLLFLMVLWFSFALLFLFSVWLKKTLPGLVLTVVMILLGVYFSRTGAVLEASFASYNPFTYFHIRDVLTMELALTVGNFNISLWNGVASLTVSTLFLLAITYFLFRFKTK
ncbi:hypothetical protein AJ85_21580 [Alkalihalobacillus alcalophilus ATCC 27647 = CGMCC 1.3604]|uniref:ABC transporter permease n=1 Tax=Alkalihalobacillus alcalophilus ATCC 27647 = CGMCC 1.3604 TaxID=1218173 RepID=A0A094WII1_ALKAL|nr:ABC transporter permease subunit [Alkalihalobacillus alcalophilus]KGA96636.1 hypothetical protein BALCAV_0215045 [Alkalihalobacillus alcalophilus ATCC 27647 = CGMCC 1.3604]MED1563624.1 ABC transporter permease subunit [Alkalihalobacillus alcalophilus]THG91980.1 hypothetical protein AJ85_21580 [Alkalihalobacillus alcalophilus ATCC 27647 = CGMCC 1.3604]